jgi:hypothetical protein
MSDIPRDELRATLAARQELGPDYDAALVDSLAERVEQVVQARVAAQQVTAPPPPVAPVAPAPSTGQSAGERIAIALGSLVLAIPSTAIAGDAGGKFGVAVVWIGVVAVNVAMGIGPALRRR